MVPFKISLKIGNKLFTTILQHKINIIMGDSGCGKTYIIDNIAKKETPVWVCPNGLVPTLDVINAQQIGSVLFFDERATSYLKSRDLLSRVLKLNYRFIFITRDFLKGIDYAYNALYTLEEDSDKYYLKRYYKDYNKIPVQNSYVTEDINSGYFFFSSKLPNVHRLQKHEDLLEFANNNNACVIADGLAFGIRMRKVIFYNLNCFLPNSLEDMLGELIFHSSIFKSYTIFDMQRYSNRTEEKCITRIFIDKCKGLNPPIIYNKTIDCIENTIIMSLTINDYYEAEDIHSKREALITTVDQFLVQSCHQSYVEQLNLISDAEKCYWMLCVLGKLEPLPEDACYL